MKKLIILFSCVLFYLLFFTQAPANLWFLLTDKGQYFIPQESNIFIFTPVEFDSGSGGGWISAKDKNYYYRLNITGKTPKYFKEEIKK
ncbi:hypothetical protein AAIR98_000241 [Elusimicrobium simillimum]|uniref:hypothetical protein n=1 Tax=Elusimicrobium simillimum TaxID=3143438 RepID=UPI003C6F3181